MNFSCASCGQDCGTKLVCDACAPHLTATQDKKLLIAWHRIVIERDNCQCVYCGLSDTADSGTLCGNHTRGRRLPFRYDTAAGECVCQPCNTNYSSLPQSQMKRKKPEPEGHKSKPKKNLCRKCGHLLAVYDGLCIRCKK